MWILIPGKSDLVYKNTILPSLLISIVPLLLYAPTNSIIHAIV